MKQIQEPELNIEDLRKHLSEFDMTPEEEEEFLRTLWDTVKMHVDEIFGIY